MNCWIGIAVLAIMGSLAIAAVCALCSAGVGGGHSPWLEILLLGATVVPLIGWLWADAREEKKRPTRRYRTSEDERLLFQISIDDIARAKERMWHRAAAAMALQAAAVSLSQRDDMLQIILVGAIGVFMSLLQVDGLADLLRSRRRKDMLFDPMAPPGTEVREAGRPTGVQQYLGKLHEVGSILAVVGSTLLFLRLM